MTRFSYREQDYAFGQAMLTLRTNIGLTQAGLAELLGVSRRAIGKWEAGGAYPKAEHLKALLAFALKQQAFDAGREEEEIRAFWKTAHQKVLLDESWLSTLVSQHLHPLERVVPPSIEVTDDSIPTLAAPVSGSRVEWGEALDVSSFYGREGELATLAQWVVQERCRVVSVLGMGGIGKSVMLGIAMGLQNAAARKLAVPDLTTTVLTLTIVGTVADSHIAGGSGSRAGRRLIAVAAMFVGALVGSLLILHVSIAVQLVIALMVTACIAVVTHLLSMSDPAWVHAS